MATARRKAVAHAGSNGIALRPERRLDHHDGDQRRDQDDWSDEEGEPGPTSPTARCPRPRAPRPPGQAWTMSCLHQSTMGLESIGPSSPPGRASPCSIHIDRVLRGSRVHSPLRYPPEAEPADPTSTLEATGQNAFSTTSPPTAGCNVSLPCSSTRHERDDMPLGFAGSSTNQCEGGRHLALRLPSR